MGGGGWKLETSPRTPLALSAARTAHVLQSQGLLDPCLLPSHFAVAFLLPAGKSDVLVRQLAPGFNF